MSVTQIRGPHLPGEVVDGGVSVLGGDVLADLAPRPEAPLGGLDLLMRACQSVQFVTLSRVDLDAAAARGQVEPLLS